MFLSSYAITLLVLHDATSRVCQQLLRATTQATEGFVTALQVQKPCYCPAFAEMCWQMHAVSAGWTIVDALCNLLAGPDVQLVEVAVKWLLQQRQEGRPVFVHCAHGHGRSTVVLCAALVAAGHANSFEEAFQEVRALRPRVKLNFRQRNTLLKWAERRSKLM